MVRIPVHNDVANDRGACPTVIAERVIKVKQMQARIHAGGQAEKAFKAHVSGRRGALFCRLDDLDVLLAAVDRHAGSDC